MSPALATNHFPTQERSALVPTRCPLSVLAAIGNMETGAPDGELTTNVARQWDSQSRGMVPRRDRRTEK